MDTPRCHTPKIKAVILVKKGMAEKAMKRNLANGDMDKLKGQIDRGTVTIIKCPAAPKP